MSNEKLSNEAENPALNKGAVSGSGIITELNVFQFLGDTTERKYYGINVSPTQDINEAINEARKDGFNGVVCGYTIDGDISSGEYIGLDDNVCL